MKERDAAVRKVDPAELTSSRSPASKTPGRLGTFAVLGAVAGSVPLPLLPDVLERRVRGALAQDVAARHGLSLTREAREVLAEPAGADGSRGVLAQALRYVTSKMLLRFGPLGMLPPLRAGLYTFALGYLFSRYLETSRSERSVRIDEGEARSIRRAMDRAIARSLTAEVNAEREIVGSSPEDLRDNMTQIVDSLLIAAAGVPSWLTRRLDAAFDDILAADTHA